MVAEFRDKPQLFEAFADPDFQYSLNDAGRAAASSDDAHTEQLLVDLLSNRARGGNLARVRLATSHAVKAADKLSQEALNGMTALWAITYLVPTAEDFPGHIQDSVETAEAIITMGLPDDENWIKDVDVLSLARIRRGASPRMRYAEIIRRSLLSDMTTGIDQSESGQLVEAAITAVPEISQFLTPHPLKPGFLKLAGKDAEELLSKLPREARDSPELQQLIGLNGYGMQDNTAMATFATVIKDSEPLSTVAEWWDNVPVVDLTVVGDVVGFVNARRHISFAGAETVAELLDLKAG